MKLTENCHRTQNILLKRILQHQRYTQFGRDHGFQHIRHLADFRRQVPIHRYEDLESYMTQVRQGNTKALLRDRQIHMFALTSGTTASRKYIPVSRQYLKDYKRGTNIWACGIFQQYPQAFLKPILQLVSDWDEYRTEGGNIPCGSISGLTSHMQRKAVRQFYCLPAESGKVKDASAKLYLALRLGLMARELGLMGSANPSTFIKLAQLMESHSEELIRDIHDGTLKSDVAIPDAVRASLLPYLQKNPERAKELETIRSREGKLLPKDAWKPIHTIGCWTGGSVGLYLKQFPLYYGAAPVRDLGLLASEGRFTIPLEEGTTGGVLDISSHYFEFIPEAEIQSPQPVTLTASELEPGKNYYLLPTTKYGLYRYNIYDVVRVLDHHHSTPIVEFLNKGSLFSNLTGEKLSEFQVVAAMKKASQLWGYLPSAYTLAPYWDERTPGYSLYLEEHEMEALPAEQLAQVFDQLLREQNMEYDTKRESQRLRGLEICVL
ncbi:MAG TPA: GH3 auxin-responsive promoter family protein, partial [Gemmatales bacterium]|nr:GH3 auxin-responsive promoter family protein [Gemmatales bacterium]